MESLVGIGAGIKQIHSPLVHSPGPIPETVSDFWRMVWEENSRTIVMLTNTHERGKVGYMACWTKKMTYGCTVCSTSNYFVLFARTRTHTHTHTHSHTHTHTHTRAHTHSPSVRPTGPGSWAAAWYTIILR